MLSFLATEGKFLLSSKLPLLATEALTYTGAAASSKVLDKISGSGVVYYKKDGIGCKIIPTRQGLYLALSQKRKFCFSV
jgi:hypothetical protein